MPFLLECSFSTILKIYFIGRLVSVYRTDLSSPITLPIFILMLNPMKHGADHVAVSFWRKKTKLIFFFGNRKKTKLAKQLQTCRSGHMLNTDLKSVVSYFSKL